jgi:hypothetical protein
LDSESGQHATSHERDGLRDTLKTGDQIIGEGFEAKSEPMTAAAQIAGREEAAADDEDGGPKSPPAP